MGSNGTYPPGCWRSASSRCWPSTFRLVQLVQLGNPAPITPENARFFAAPLPVVLHILGTVIYGLLSAFQFAPGLHRRHPKWHRMAGRVLVGCGLVVALSGLWMTWFYPPIGLADPLPPARFDGPVLFVMRLLAGSAMAIFIVLGFTAARRRNIPQH